MALINCPECNKEISEKVGTVCPNCGHVVEKPVRVISNFERGARTLIGSIFFGALMILLMAFQNPIIYLVGIIMSASLIHGVFTTKESIMFEKIVVVVIMAVPILAGVYSLFGGKI